MNTARVIAWSFAGAATLGVLVLLASWYLEERRVCEPLGRRMTDQEICEAFRRNQERAVRRSAERPTSRKFSSLDVQLKSCRVLKTGAFFGRGRYIIEYSYVNNEHYMNVVLPIVLDQCATFVGTFNPSSG